MTKAISIHIGLNNVDPNAYEGWDGQLFGCVNDALAMQNIADSLGYLSTVVLNEQATADQIISEIGQAAWNLDANGILLLTFSGHGGQMPDTNGDEADGSDETWVLYDRQLIDDELYNLWSQFTAGARIVVISDSCHSGTVSRVREYQSLQQVDSFARHYRTRSGPPRFRGIPNAVGVANYQHNRPKYAALQFASGSRTRDIMDASVLLISGCQDNQLSSDGDTNGLFTGTLLSVWQNGAFSGNYAAFHQAILNQMPSTQTPNYYLVGTDNPDFEGQNPFTADTASTGGSAGNTNGAGSESWPSIKGPSSVTRSGPPPSFTVNAGPGRVFIAEAGTNPWLFDITNHGNERTSDNFYGSWSDTSPMQGSSYCLPSAVWERLGAADRLYYRIGSSTDANYSDYQVSSSDTAGESIPVILING